MLFHAGLFADITNLSFPLIFHTILDLSLSFPSPSLLCVLGRSACEQGCWGNYTGTLSVSGKNIFIPFHMDGAWWACFNVPWVCGIVRLYSIFYYLMEKEVYFFIFWKKKKKPWNKIVCVYVCGGGWWRKWIWLKTESPPEISPLPLIFISWMVWFCWQSSPFA